MKYLYLFIILFLSYNTIQAKPAVKITHDFKSSVSDGVIDKKGFLWFISNNKLYKYDGYNFVTINDVSHNNTKLEKLKILEDKLFISNSSNGIISYDICTGAWANVLAYKKVTDFIILKNGLLYLITLDGFLIEKNKSTLRKFKVSNVFDSQSNSASNLIFFNDVLYLSFYNDGLYSFKNDCINKIKTLDGNYYNGFLKTFNNRLFLINRSFIVNDILMKHNLFEIYANGTLVNKTEPIFFNDFLYKGNDTFYVDPNEHIYLNKERIYTNQLLKKKDLKYKFIAFNNGFYLISQHGLFTFIVNNTKKIVQSIYDNKFPTSRIRRKIIKCNDTLIFFGNPCPMIQTKDKTYYFDKYVHSVYDAIQIGNKYYLATEGDGLICTDLKKLDAQLFTKENEKYIISLCYDSLTNQLYFAGYNNIFSYNLLTKTTNQFTNPLKGFAVKKILKLNATQLFVATNSGAFVLDVSNGSTKVIHELDGANIGDVLFKNNYFYVGFESGIHVLTTEFNIINTISLTNFSNPIVCTLESAGNNVIIGSTYAGIFLLQIHSGKITYLNKNNGLLNTEYNYKSICKIDDNQFIFGGMDGYDFINLNNFSLIEKNEAVGIISGYQLLGNNDSKTYYNYNDIEIIYNRDEHFLRLFYATTHKIDDIAYYYTLNNLTIFNSNKNYIDFVGLKEGSYTVQIVGYDTDGNTIHFKPVKVIVKERFFKSKLFFILLSIIILVISAVVLAYILHLKRKEKKIFEQISMDLHDEIGSYLYKSKLVLDRSNIENNKKEILHDYIGQATYSLRVFINDVDKKSVAFYDLINDINDLFKKDIAQDQNFLFSIENNLNKNIHLKAALYRDLKFIFFEISNNYFKHSLANKLAVIFNCDGNKLVCNVYQSGAFEHKTISKGKGLHNIKKRVQKWNGTVDFVTEPHLYTINFCINI